MTPWALLCLSLSPQSNLSSGPSLFPGWEGPVPARVARTPKGWVEAVVWKEAPGQEPSCLGPTTCGSHSFVLSQIQIK